jgi:hypothetical protein
MNRRVTGVVRRIPGLRTVAQRSRKQLLAPVASRAEETFNWLSEVNHRVVLQEGELEALRAKLRTVEQHLPAVIGTIASSNGVARRLTRDSAALHERLEASEKSMQIVSDDLADQDR